VCVCQAHAHEAARIGTVRKPARIRSLELHRLSLHQFAICTFMLVYSVLTHAQTPYLKVFKCHFARSPAGAYIPKRILGLLLRAFTHECHSMPMFSTWNERDRACSCARGEGGGCVRGVAEGAGGRGETEMPGASIGVGQTRRSLLYGPEISCAARRF
jgi:hypothetical protein